MTFYEWLAKIDAPTAAYVRRDHHSPAEFEAFHRGFWEGQWSALYTLYEYLERGATDPENLVGTLAAELVALKRRRSPRDFRLAFERHLRVLPRSVEEPPPITDDDIQRNDNGGFDGSPAA